MLAAARRAAKMLGDSAGLVASFVRGRQAGDGGFCGRSADSDLYYTVFAVQSLLALGAEADGEALRGYLRCFGGGAGLDVVHLSCLARCWADLGAGPGEKTRGEILARIEACRSADGGYGSEPGEASGTAYGSFLALSACQDLGAAVPDADRLAEFMESLRVPGGGYGNSPTIVVGMVPVTAAAVCVMLQLHRPPGDEVGQWLLSQCRPGGGFTAAPGVPAPDLLSTATALHALARSGTSLAGARQACLGFVNGLWNPKGGFGAYQGDETMDCEYTYYGLLALGHLGE